VRVMRDALEGQTHHWHTLMRFGTCVTPHAGPIASAGLHQWIDLVFGCKQVGEAAATACNTFYYLTYPSCASMVQQMQVRRAALKFVCLCHAFGSVRTSSCFSQPRNKFQVLDKCDARVC
jgi:hypothetical protein